MRLGVLFSGGKDSTLALHLAAEKEEVACLITVVSKNKESYMFHTPNIDMTALAGGGVGVAAGFGGDGGQKGGGTRRFGECHSSKPKANYDIEGVVTGAVESVYQASRVQRICNKLGPLVFQSAVET